MSLPDRIGRMRDRFERALAPERLDIIDDSHKHVGHAGARGGAGHYSVLIVSSRFAGQPLLERHRMVYDAVRDMLNTDIHALSIQARTPDEHSSYAPHIKESIT